MSPLPHEPYLQHEIVRSSGPPASSLLSRVPSLHAGSWANTRGSTRYCLSFGRCKNHKRRVRTPGMAAEPGDRLQLHKPPHDADRENGYFLRAHICKTAGVLCRCGIGNPEFDTETPWYGEPTCGAPQPRAQARRHCGKEPC